MSDQLPGGGPAFEEPDFSSFAPAEDSVDGDDDGDDDDVEDEFDDDEGDDEGDDDESENRANVADANVAYAGAADESVAEHANYASEDNEGGSPRAVLEHIARSIVDEKEAVVIETKEVRGQLRLYLHVAPGDMGRIIGRRGRTAQAVRTLVRAAAASEGHDVFVEIVD